MTSARESAEALWENLRDFQPKVHGLIVDRNESGARCRLR
jgi:hypothetical protein